VIIINARNANTALLAATKMLNDHGYNRPSRNGEVVIAPDRVTTHYQQPLERIIVWPERDYNPAFVLYEALWMLAGRDDVESLVRYVKNFSNYSDDGVTLHGAYGFRWRNFFQRDQLGIIADRLRKDPNDRRCVLQMWDTKADLDVPSKDVPCNVIATFQRDQNGRLDMSVFCRSNDMLFGTYYANAFHFGMLLEYMALAVGCPVGTYEQISVNFHAYLETFGPLRAEFEDRYHEVLMDPMADAYSNGDVQPIFMDQDSIDIGDIDEEISAMLKSTDDGFPIGHWVPDAADEPWIYSIYTVLYAHHLYKTLPDPSNFKAAGDILNTASTSIDWVASMMDWLATRYERKAAKA
jgi:thymidylate synthase